MVPSDSLAVQSASTDGSQDLSDKHDSDSKIIQSFGSRLLDKFWDFAIGILTKVMVFESSPDLGVLGHMLSTAAPHVPDQGKGPRSKMSEYFPQSVLRMGSESDEVEGRFAKTFCREC